MNLLSRVVFWVLLLGVSDFVAAASPPISSYRIEAPTSAQLASLAKSFEIRHESGQSYEVLVSRPKVPEFLTVAPQARLILADISEPVRRVYQQSRVRFASGGGGYHSFAEVVGIMKQLAAAHPGTVELVTYGQSAQKRPLQALRIGHQLHPQVKAGGQPRILLTAATHGDEIITTEILLSLTQEILNPSGSSNWNTTLLDQVELLVVPVLNPDGFVDQYRYDNGSDPNRSYPYPEEPNRQPTPSIAGIIHLIQNYPISGSLDFHAFGRLVMYPWAYTRASLPPPDMKVFEQLTEKMAATNHYQHGQISKVIYVAAGSSADFYFWKQRSLSVAVEVGESKAPPPGQIPRYLSEQRASTQIFLQSFLH